MSSATGRGCRVPALPFPVPLYGLRMDTEPNKAGPYRILYDSGEGVFFYWGPNGGEPVAIDEAVDLTAEAANVAVGVLTADGMDRVIVEQAGVPWGGKPGRVPVWVYDREDADPVHDVLDAGVAVYTRGGRHDAEECDAGWVELERSDWYELRRLVKKYPGLVELKPSIRGT